MRVVSLCPSLTELVFDLGRGSELVGRTRFCVHPEDRVEAVEAVGGTKDPDIARIVTLAPDLVLFNEEENRREDFEALEASGLNCLNTFPKDADQTADMVREVGVALERGAQAEELARRIEERAVAARAGARDARPLRFAYLIWRKPWMTVNGDTFASALLELAGGVNAFARAETRYPEVTLDELRAAELELVLLCTEPFPFAEKHVDEVAQALDLPEQAVRIADGEFLSWHGSRTPDGIDYAAQLLREAR